MLWNFVRTQMSLYLDELWRTSLIMFDIFNLHKLPSLVPWTAISQVFSCFLHFCWGGSTKVDWLVSNWCLYFAAERYVNSRSYCVPPLEAWIFVGLFYVFLVADFVKNSLNAYEMSCVYLIKHLYIYTYICLFMYTYYFCIETILMFWCVTVYCHIFRLCSTCNYGIRPLLANSRNKKNCLWIRD